MKQSALKVSKKLKKYAGGILVVCFLAYFVLSWILLFRDGRALYAIGDFYPQIKPFITALEPNTIKYGINSIPTLLFAFITILAFSAYIAAFHAKMTVKKIVVYAVIFQCIMLFSYPSLATDIFSYIMSDRVATVYHQNVWLTKPQEFSFDLFSRLADWQYQPRVYGQVNQFFYNFVSVGGKNDLLLTVFLYKSLVFIFSLGTMVLVYKLAKRFFSGSEGIALLTIFWNPLFVLEIIGSGHNDMLMVFFTLLSIYFFKDKRWLLAGIAIGAAVQVKIIVILLFGFLAFDLLIKKKFSAFSVLFASFVIFNALMFWTMQVSPFVFLQNISFNVGVYWQSLPQIIHTFFPQEKLIFSGGFLFVLIFLLFYQWRRSVDPITMYTYAIFFYLVFFTTAHWNWYILWIVTLIPFIASRSLKNVLVVFSFTALLSYPLFWLALRLGHEHFLWYLLRYLFLSVIPLLSLFYFVYYRTKTLFPIKP